MATSVRMMGPATAIRTCPRKYVTFSGRATRAEHWWFWWFGGAMFWAADRLDQVILGTTAEAYGPLWIAANLGLVLPGASATARRLQDPGKSAELYLSMYGLIWSLAAAKAILGIPLSQVDAFLSSHLGGTALTLLAFPIAFLGGVLILCTLPSKPGPNRYGPDPFGRPAADEEAPP